MAFQNPASLLLVSTLLVAFLVLVNGDEDEKLNIMSREEQESLREEARDMFYHAYRAYMDNAYPADELMPLTCQGRYRGSHPSRGDIDDTLGNFSLTLIDTLDTLVILGDISEFEHAVKLVIKDVSFDSDIVVSVFETNIRVLGGLLSAHILAEYVQQKIGVMEWYKGELLELAKDIGYRLTPAFNTTTGIPHARVNLRTGMKAPSLWSSRETCTACAGTMILEMAALSRLTGDHFFEEKAHRAMDGLWKLRHRSTDLMGTVLNVHSGDWIRRDSGVGAGIDSYYEYCLKAYILLGDNRYLSRFNKHYSAVMKYISQGPMLLDVHMHRPTTNSRNFMDALLAFWPGLQVLNGDLKPAVETHEMLYQVMQRHTFIPEAFTTDFKVYWGQYPLRPEFLESTYFLYKATGDHYYLQVGKKILKGLQQHARVPCGYAAVSDVRTGQHDDRMDSFVLAETFKYLYLLFTDPADLIVDLDKFIFTTEAHLLPLDLSKLMTNSSAYLFEDDEEIEEPAQCPTSLRLLPDQVRKPLRNFVHDTCPSDTRTKNRRLLASHFQSGNPEHKKIIGDMGISIAHLDDGRIQLLHSFSKAKSVGDAKEGLLFMQEMLELAKSQSPETLPQAVQYVSKGVKHTLNAGPAHFGKQLRGNHKVSGNIDIAFPFKACDPLVNAKALKGKIVLVQRGDCMFIEKARKIMQAGAIGGIVMDNSGDSSKTSPMFAMSGDGTDDITIPVVFLFYQDAWKLLMALTGEPNMLVTLADRQSSQEDQPEGNDTIDDASVHNFLFNKVPTGEGEIVEVKGEELIRLSNVSPQESNSETNSAEDSLPTRMHKILSSLHKDKNLPEPPSD
ncbi:ER degradation-enhancing alpha-mannosidase-like protein 3 [Cimex lectularius]|uniref:alpha-1,2-Mannosidase n=1 Tax=Cimex lectularius TaxID=79782 RepID=A0A8I6RFG6_CIMLE|nr:ER degradation-enhancing alpha-mannosidase-like protein 3 [Cimex lectularius]